jgi:ABC-type nitrate/sulfonate/bicarbonate transport system ATPase subunit
MQTDTVLEVRKLQKKYGSNLVLDNLSLSIRRAERVALVAPSGTGKTTLVRILCGLEQADKGEIRLAEPIGAVIFQETRLFPFLTVEENIYLPFKACGKPISDEIRKRCDEWLEVCELGAFRARHPFQLSGGMKQKVTLIRGLLDSPRFVIMDEPFQSIDMDSKKCIIQFLLKTNPHMTLLFITHIREELPLLAQRVITLQPPLNTNLLPITQKVFNLHKEIV